MSNQNRFEKIADQLERHFDKRVEIYGGGLQAVDWKSREAQYNRFRQLLKVVDFSAPFSILDYGCGDGELINLLTANRQKFEYFGFDVSKQMLNTAKTTFAGREYCHFLNRVDDSLMIDYTVASGIFNLKFETDDNEWQEYMINKVNEINAISKKGFAFNALTTYSDIEFRRQNLYYADPLFWFDYCKKNISRYVSLLHDYPEYDFTIIVRK